MVPFSPQFHQPVGPTAKDTLNELYQKQRDLEDEARKLSEEKLRITQLIRDARVNVAREERAEREKKKEEERLERLRKIEEEQKKREAELVEVAKHIEDAQLKSWGSAHPYQKSAIVAAYHNYKRGDSGFFNADDMGLGKTFQAISIIELYLRENPDKNVLWLSKSSIVETGGTEREIKQWSDIPVVSVLGKETKQQRSFKVELVDQYQKGTVLITNYEMMRTTETLRNAEFGMIIMDEVHKLKGGANPSGPTGTWKSIRNYIWPEIDGVRNKKSVDFILMLSGTPMVNRVAELWAYLHIFDPERFDSLKAFERAFDAYVEYGGKVQTAKILDIALKDRMVRRTRDEVGLELPEFNLEYRMVEYNPEQQKAYDQMRDRFLVWLDEQETEALTATAVIAQLTRLRQISVWPVFKQEVTDPMTGELHVHEINVPSSAKVDEAMDIIEEANDQVVVFCNFNSVFDEIKRRTRELGLKCEFITGATKAQMSQFETGFQNGDIDVLCINSSMGEGLNLQKNPERWKGGASIAIHLDRWWNPARDEQCNARIHRQGSKHPVFVYMIHSPNSVDDFVKGLSDDKAEIFEGIMSDKQLRTGFEWKEMLKEIL